MHNVSQRDAANDMPLTPTERTSFWRDGRFGGMECLSATFQTHAYAPHAHDTFSIGAIESGSQITRIRAHRALEESAGALEAEEGMFTVLAAFSCVTEASSARRSRRASAPPSGAPATISPNISRRK